MASRLLSADEVADKLGMAKEWVWEQSRRGYIPAIRLGRYYRYREDSIDAWLASIELDDKGARERTQSAG